MSKRALKKKRAELEALLTDRYEALGEVVLGMHGRGEWDDQILARGAAEVREVISELESLDLGETAAVPGSTETGGAEAGLAATGPVQAAEPGEPESRADHLFAETAEHRMDEGDDLPAGITGDEEGDGEADAAAVPSEPPEPEGEADGKAEPEAEQPGDADRDPESEALGVDEPAEDRGQGAPTPAGAESGEDHSGGDGPTPEAGEERSTGGDRAADQPEPGRPETGKTPPPVTTKQDGAREELESVATRIDEREREAKVASEAARAALQADSKTELSAITRSIEDERTSLDHALEVAAKRISSAEQAAENARSRLTRELASNREAAASWVRNQAEEIEADAALAQELATVSYEDETGGLGGDAGEARMQAMESEITSLKANLEAEKASKAEALAKAEVRVREIEAAAREAERKVDEARKWAPEEARLEDKRAREAELREAAVLWLRGQVAAVREQGESGDGPDGRSGQGGGD